MTETLVVMEPSMDGAPEGAPFGSPADAGLSPEELAAIAGLVRKARELGVAVPRDRDGSFEPQLVAKRQRRLSDVDTLVISLFAEGLTTGEISAHLAEVYGASISKDTISRITDKIVEEMNAWWARPLESVYAAIFIDAIIVKVRDGQVGNQPFYAAIGVDLEGHKDILGIWPGQGGGESAKYWLAVSTDLKNRGVADVFFLVCDGLKGLPDSVTAVFPARPCKPASSM